MAWGGGREETRPKTLFLWEGIDNTILKVQVLLSRHSVVNAQAARDYSCSFDSPHACQVVLEVVDSVML